MTLENNFLISSSYDRSIIADVSFDESQEKLPIVIFCHGYKGYKDWGAWNLVANSFAIAGLFFLKFNFSHNGGTVDQPIDFPDLEAFGQNNFSKEVDNIGSVLDYLHGDNIYNKHYDLNNITIIGHSRGGGMSIIRASFDTRIHKVISWAAIADIGGRFPKGDLMQQWKKDGIRYITNGRTLQKMPHNYSFYEDYVENKELLNIKKATQLLQIPHLIINGEADTAVKPEEAKLLQGWNPGSKLHLINRCGHTFGTKHPWERKDLPIFMTEVVEVTLSFIQSA